MPLPADRRMWYIWCTMRRTKPIPRTWVRIARSKTGLGLFATRLIFPGMYIEYRGTLLSEEQVGRLKSPRYLFELNKKWTIDGSPRNNIARYINHSCQPNCESIQAGTRIFIKALVLIPPGTELVYDYGPEYTSEFIRPHGCKCRKCLT